MRQLSKLVVLLVLASGWTGTARADGPLVGKPCPDFALAGAVQGEPWQKADLLGSVVVLDLFQLG